MKRSREGEYATQEEMNYLFLSKCPSCEAGEMYEGPNGGLSVNFRCDCCGQGFNIGFGKPENIGIDPKWIRKSLKEIRKIKLKRINHEQI